MNGRRKRTQNDRARCTETSPTHTMQSCSPTQPIQPRAVGCRFRSGFPQLQPFPARAPFGCPSGPIGPGAGWERLKLWETSTKPVSHTGSDRCPNRGRLGNRPGPEIGIPARHWHETGKTGLAAPPSRGRRATDGRPTAPIRGGSKPGFAGFVPVSHSSP